MSKNFSNFKKEHSKKGVALLFAIVVSMILFTILAGVLNVALKETIFSTSVKNSNDAFYSADSGVECALYNDKTTSTVFAHNNTGDVSCFGNPSVSVSKTGSTDVPKFDFVVIVPNENFCAKVFVEKTYDPINTDPVTFIPILLSTKITSKGYNKGGNNNCDQAGLKSVERVLEVEY
jgi:hypothetical protein